ncbi:MAG: hypothetical protein LBI17_01160 [Rickettsiales bacterium]|jgi:hypothetical protein|nr:hypothetical protein [Rickettsiales bacterium]
MKNSTWCLSLFLVCGCDSHFPTRFANSYFANVYFTHEARYYSSSKGDYNKIEYGVGCGIGECDTGYVFGGAFGQYFDRIWVFQDTDRQCLLYSYTDEELVKLKKDAGFSRNSSRDVILLGKTGISVIPVKEYNAIVPTLRPHSYDQSLCKPMPENITKIIH